MKKTKVKKVPSYAKLKKKLDTVFSIWIRERDQFVCFTCGKRGDRADSQNGHYISRTYLATRWDEQNCHCQCAACNIFKHGNMTAYACRMVAKYGVDILETLEQRKNQSVRFTPMELQVMISRYENRLGAPTKLSTS